MAQQPAVPMSALLCVRCAQGVQPLLDAVVAYLPSPLDVPPVRGSEVDHPDVALTRRPDDSETFSALAFKIMADQFVGSLTFLRIYRRALAPWPASKFSCASGNTVSLWAVDLISRKPLQSRLSACAGVTPQCQAILGATAAWVLRVHRGHITKQP